MGFFPSFFSVWLLDQPLSRGVEEVISAGPLNPSDACCEVRSLANAENIDSIVPSFACSGPAAVSGEVGSPKHCLNCQGHNFIKARNTLRV